MLHDPNYQEVSLIMSSAYDPTLLHDAAAKMNDALSDITTEMTSRTRDIQQIGKWGTQPSPADYKQTYAHDLDDIHQRIMKAMDNVYALHDSLQNIGTDAADADAAAAVLAAQIAAKRAAVNQTTTSM